MEVKLDKRYELGVPAQNAWAVLSDLESVASCMPGASLGEKLGDNAYKGSVKVKVGPATAQFGGEVEILSMDVANKSLVLKGKGADKGGSSASMELEATIEEVDGQSILVGLATVIVNGKFAQFGGRMMVQVSDVILKQFVDNFIAKAQALSGSDVTHSADTGANESHSETANELNGLAVCWVLLKSWFGGLFGKKPAS
ncbi:MAG: carbon monoxide dehydrogenase [Gammaproteobacteria bacterium]|nr:carbon monoxide dehydrogenase [Gammaproteobacteria bacterium]